MTVKLLLFSRLVSINNKNYMNTLNNLNYPIRNSLLML